MKHDCRGGGWTMKIANAVNESSDGDTLLVANQAARDLAMRARDRMRPGLILEFEVEQLSNRLGVHLDPPRDRLL